MKVVIFVALIFGAVTADRCCFPEQYEAISDSMIGTGSTAGMPASLNKMTGKVSYDYKLKMLNYNFTGDYNGHAYTARSLQDYKNKVMYTIKPDGTCDKMPVYIPDIMESNCFDDSMKVRDGYIGSPKNKVPISVYTVNGQGSSVTFTVDKDCVLIDSVRTTGNSMQASRLTDITLGIADPSVFKLPSSCKKAPKL